MTNLKIPGNEATEGEKKNKSEKWPPWHANSDVAILLEKCLICSHILFYVISNHHKFVDRKNVVKKLHTLTNKNGGYVFFLIFFFVPISFLKFSFLGMHMGEEGLNNFTFN